MSEIVEDIEDTEVTPFTEGEREIAYRAEAEPSGPASTERQAVIAPGLPPAAARRRLPECGSSPAPAPS